MTSLLIGVPDFTWNNPDKTVDQLIDMMIEGLKP